MISIHSAEENEFIRNYVEEQSSSSVYMWIGLKKNTSNSYQFGWVDNSPLDFFNWNQLNGYLRHAEMWIYGNGTWNDIDDENSSFTCAFNCKLSIKISIIFS